MKQCLLFFVREITGQDRQIIVNKQELSLNRSAFYISKGKLINDGRDDYLQDSAISVSKNKKIKISQKPDGGFFDSFCKNHKIKYKLIIKPKNNQK